jgi:hypothetical protein
MAMAFSKPRLLIDNFLSESSLLYGIVPLTIFVTFYVFLSLYLSQTSVFLKILPISDNQYFLYGINDALVNVIDFLIFGVVIYATSKILQLYEVNIKKVFLFFMFIWNTIGLLAVPADLLSFTWNLPFLMVIHPICLIIDIAYVSEFIHKQNKINRWKSLILLTPGVIAFLAFRIIFLR